MKQKKSNDSQATVRENMSSRGHRAKAIRGLEIAKAKPEKEEMIYVSSQKFFPKLLRHFSIEVPKSMSLVDVELRIEKIVNRAVSNDFKSLEV